MGYITSVPHLSRISQGVNPYHGSRLCEHEHVLGEAGAGWHMYGLQYVCSLHNVSCQVGRFQ